MLNSKDTDGIIIFWNLTIQSSFLVDGEDISLWLSLPLKIKMTEWDSWNILRSMTSVKLYFMETLSNKIRVSYSHKPSEMTLKSSELLELPLYLKSTNRMKSWKRLNLLVNLIKSWKTQLSLRECSIHQWK